MKIAMMTNNYKPFIGGVPVSVELLSEGLRKLGHQVTVFAPTYKEQLAEENVVRYHTFLEGPYGGVAFPNPMDIRIEQEFKRQHFDLIHVHHPMLIGRTAVHLSRKYNIPLTFTYHTRYDQYLHYIPPVRLMEQHAGKSGINRKMLCCIHEKIVPAYLNSFMKHCSHVFVPTDGLCGYLTNYGLMDNSRISVLPTGLKESCFTADDSEIAALRRKYDCENMPLFLTVSRMAHEKNLPFLIKAVKSFKKKYNKNFRMLLVGDGPNIKEFKQLCETLDLPELVFTGKLDNSLLPTYYHAADAFLFASKTETQGIVILEAFAGSTPVVAVKASGVSDLVENGKNGCLTPEDVDYFSDGILNVLENKTSENAIFQESLREGALASALDYREDAIAKIAEKQYINILHRFYRRDLLQFA